MPIQWLDVILILIMLLSAFLAMTRGLTAEMLSLVSWALAALVALFVYQLYRERVRSLIGSQLVADLLLIGVVFLIVLLIMGVITPRLFPVAPTSPVGTLDRTLGFVYGLIRGLLLVVIAYEVTAALVPKESLPRWVTEARSLPIIERTGRAMLSLLPDNPSSIFRGGDRAAGIPPHERRAALRLAGTHFHIVQPEQRAAISARAGAVSVQMQL